MSHRAKSQASVPRSRPAGGRRNQQPACTPEDSGVRRSTRSHSNVAPTPPESEETQRSRKASMEENPVIMQDGGPSGGQLSAHGGEAELTEEEWALQRPGEPLSTYASRIMSHLREYEEARTTIRRLREELRCASANAAGASKQRKAQLQAEVQRLEMDISELEERKAFISQNGGIFKEKLINDDRFREMADNREQRQIGLLPESQVGEDDDDGDQQKAPPGSLQSHPQATCSELPAGQVTVTSGRSSAGSGEDGDNSNQGGALMVERKLLESPVCLQNFHLGDDLPEETPGDKRKAKKTTPKLQEAVSYVYAPLPVSPEPAAGPARCIGPAAQPSPGSAVDPVQRRGEITKRGSEAQSSVSACSSGDVAEGASAERLDSAGGPAAGVRSGHDTVVRSSVGGRSSPVSGAAPVASAPPSAVAADHLVEKRRQCEGAAGAENPGPPTRLLFCVGAAGQEDSAGQWDPDGKDQRHLTAVKDQRRLNTKQRKSPTDDVEGTCKTRGEAASSSMEVAEPLVPDDAEVSPTVTGPAGVNAVVNEANSLSNAVNGGVGAGVVEGEMVMEVGGNDVGADVVTGPVAPPAVVAPVGSYAGITAGGNRASSSSPGSGDGMLQRRLLEALKRGERSLMVEGREVDLSFWIERHGLEAFRERRGGTVRSPPTAGLGSARRNVVRLQWRGSDACPPRSEVVKLLLGMGFKAIDIYALIHPYATPVFDVSFVRPEGLELFWSNYELAKNEPGWRDFAVEVVSRQNEVKKVTVITHNETLSCYDIMTWLSRYGEVVEMPKKNLDDFDIWSGAWTFMVKLKRSGGTVAHIPSSAFLGRDRILVFYQGQPKLCHKCGDPTHFSANCTVQKCALCGDVGHLAASCGEIRCHLCGDLGHPFSRCPRSFANAAVTPVRESREANSAGEGTSRGEGAEGPGMKSKKKTPAQQRRTDKRRQEREPGEPRATGAAPVLDASLAAEASRDDEVDEEIRRIHREESATSSESSYYESMDEDSRQWLEDKRKLGKKRKKGDKTSSPALTKVPKEGKTDSPLVGLSNRFQALENISSSEEEDEGTVLASAGPTGGAESPPSGGARSSGGETGPKSGDEDDRKKKHVEMDMSVSKKRGKDSSSEAEDKGSGKKQAV